MKIVPQQRGFAKITAVLVAIAALSALHFGVAIGTHGLHLVHLIFAVLYLVPLIAAAVWFGALGALVAATVTSSIYYVHIRYSWANQPMENADQYAHIAVYWVVAAVTGIPSSVFREKELAPG